MCVALALLDQSVMSYETSMLGVKHLGIITDNFSLALQRNFGATLMLSAGCDLYAKISSFRA